MNYSILNDETLIRLIAQAKADALSELYDRYSRLVFSLALNIVRDHNTAEEVALDVFIRVWQSASTYRADQAKVNTWLVSITRHRAIDVLRQANRRLEHNSSSWAEVSSNHLPSVATSEELAERTIQQAQIRAAVTQLPKEQREVLALAYFSGYTHRQIAESLDQPLGTVKTRIRSAIQKLRRILDEE